MFIPQFNGDRLAFFFYSNLSTTSLICCLNVLDRRRRTDSNVRVVAGRRGGVGLVFDRRRRTDSSFRVVAGRRGGVGLVLDRRRRTDSSFRVVAGRRGGVGLVFDRRREPTAASE